MTLADRLGYVAVIALVGLAGGGAAAGVGPLPTTEVVVGAGSAWVVQAATWWPLSGDLAAGRSATRSWIGGIAARLGGLAVLAVAAGPTGLERGTTLLAYAGAALTFLTLEAIWLHVTGPDLLDAGDETTR
ncbi:MAG: hypothetical protein R3266_14185 [Gemmatimonadota bacterium]|nr:hypothetical protein [Gemmatimonadota bacterium]